MLPAHYFLELDGAFAGAGHNIDVSRRSLVALPDCLPMGLLMLACDAILLLATTLLVTSCS